MFNEIALLLMISAATASIALWLRQPALIAYIVVGIIVGPSLLGLVSSHDQIDLLSQVGVTVLLFVVGLKLDLRHVKHIGPVALATGLGQLAFTIAFGFLILLFLGKGYIESLYVAIALTFSSTIIIVKLLSDKRELDSLHGRIAVGFLIVQDLAVVLAMMTMSTLRAGADSSTFDIILSLGGRLIAASVLMYIFMRFLLPWIVRSMAKSQELLLIFAVGWGTSLAGLGEVAGFSKEAGAFLAGFSLASTTYRDAISARLTGLRDFLLLFFFIDLGSKLDFSTLGQEVLPSIALSFFVLIGNPLIVLAIMGYMGYKKRTGFLAGLTVAQISEFSIIFVAMGISLGHIDNGALGLTTLVGLVTITVSTYMILYSNQLYTKLAPWMGIFERKTPHRESEDMQNDLEKTSWDIIVIGLGRYGSQLDMGLANLGYKVLGVDFDPEIVRDRLSRGLPIEFGDGADAEFVKNLPLQKSPWVVSTLPSLDCNKSLLQALRESDFSGEVALVLRESVDDETLVGLGNLTILDPMRNAVDFAVSSLAKIIQEKNNPS